MGPTLARGTAWRGAAQALSAGLAGEGDPPAQVPGLAEHDVEGELQNESKLDTFRERFGNVIPDWLLKRLESSGFTVPTAVQVCAPLVPPRRPRSLPGNA